MPAELRNCGIIESPTNQTGYIMIKSLEVANFKCYKQVGLKNLRRMNVILGLNGSGKTALMESLFLASGGSPELAIRIRAFRGLDRMAFTQSDPSTFENLWIDLFHQFDKSQRISIRLIDSSGKPRSLEISTSPERGYVLPVGDQPVENAIIGTPLNFAYRFGVGKPEVHPMQLTVKGLQIGASKNVYRAALLSPHGHGHHNLAQRFSDISKSGEDASVIEVLREDFPQIEDLRIELLTGNVPAIWVKVKSVKRRFPIELLSSGITNYLAILLAIANCRNGSVLVDEIENGVHYTVLPQMWRRVHAFAKKFDTQIFASTHSMECLQAMLPIMEGHDSEFSLLRTTNRDGASLVEQFDGKNLHAAISENFELRS